MNPARRYSFLAVTFLTALAALLIISSKVGAQTTPQNQCPQGISLGGEQEKEANDACFSGDYNCLYQDRARLGRPCMFNATCKSYVEGAEVTIIGKCKGYHTCRAEGIFDKDRNPLPISSECKFQPSSSLGTPPPPPLQSPISITVPAEPAPSTITTPPGGTLIYDPSFEEPFPRELTDKVLPSRESSTNQPSPDPSASQSGANVGSMGRVTEGPILRGSTISDPVVISDFSYKGEVPEPTDEEQPVTQASGPTFPAAEQTESVKKDENKSQYEWYDPRKYLEQFKQDGSKIEGNDPKGVPLNADRVTFYGADEGNYEGSGLPKFPNMYGKRELCTLDDYDLGTCSCVTVASHPDNRGQYLDLGTVTWRSGLDGQQRSLDNVCGYVHDIGCYYTSTCRSNRISGPGEVPRFEGPQRYNSYDIASINATRGVNPDTGQPWVPGTFQKEGDASKFVRSRGNEYGWARPQEFQLIPGPPSIIGSRAPYRGNWRNMPSIPGLSNDPVQPRLPGEWYASE